MRGNPKQEKMMRQLKNPFLFRIFTRRMVPAAAHAGVKFVSLTDASCDIKMPYRRRNKNPFRSMYFAVQSMAAEMSTALPIMYHLQSARCSIAWIVVDFDVSFPAKATGDVTFTCEQVEEVEAAVKQAEETGEAVEIRLETVGRLADGKIVSQFAFNWSLKRRD